MSNPATATTTPPVSSAVVERSIDLVLAVGVLLAMLVEAGVRATSRPGPNQMRFDDDGDEFDEFLRREPWHAAPATPWWAIVAVALFTAFCIVIRRRYPLPSAVAIGVIAMPAALVLNVPLVITAAFAIALYTLAAEQGWPPALITGGLSVLMVALATALDDAEGGALITAVFAVMVVVVPLLLAANTRSRRSYLMEVEARLAQADSEQAAAAARAVAEERVRVARDLHDVLAHSLTVVNLQVGVAAHLVPTHPDRALRALDEARQAGSAAVAELRSTLAIMRGDETESLTPVPRLGDIPELVRGVVATGLRVDLHSDVPATVVVPDAVALVAFRVVQEGLTNVVRHVGTDTSATVALAATETLLTVTVSDTGEAESRRDRVAAVSPGSGLGLTGLAERCTALGGTLTAGPLAAGGFSVHAALPLGPMISTDHLIPAPSEDST